MAFFMHFMRARAEDASFKPLKSENRSADAASMIGIKHHEEKSNLF